MNTILLRQVLSVVSVVCVFSSSSNLLAEDSGHALQMKCAKSSTYFHEIKINNGVRTEKAVVSAPVATFRIPVTRNSDEYVNCLETQGENPRIAKLAYFDELDRCRAKAAVQAVISISAENREMILSTTGGSADIDRCLRGGERDIEVELLTEKP